MPILFFRGTREKVPTLGGPHLIRIVIFVNYIKILYISLIVSTRMS